MKNLIQWVLLLGGLYFLHKRFVEENKNSVKAMPPIQRQTQNIMTD